MKFKSRLQLSICATINLFIVVNSATIPQNILEKMSNEKSLQKFNNSLFDPRSVELSECEANKPLCTIFYDMLLTLAASNVSINMTEEELQKELLDQDGKAFCEKFSKSIPQKFQFKETKEKMMKLAGKVVGFCAKECVSFDEEFNTIINPMCGKIYVGYQKSSVATPVTVLNGGGNISIVSSPVAGVIPEAVVGKVETKKDEVVAALPAAVPPKLPVGPETPKVIEPKIESIPEKHEAKPEEHKEAKSNEALPAVPIEAIKPKVVATKPAVIIPSNNATSNKPEEKVVSSPELDQPEIDPPSLDLEKQNQQNLLDFNNNNNDEDTINGGMEGEDEEGQEVDSSEDLPQENNQPIETPQKPRQDIAAAYPNVDDAGPKVVQITDPFYEEGESNFFGYFLFLMLVCIVLYVVYHNKSKILALVLEGRRSSNGGRGGSLRGRKHTAAYRKLDSNLEEAITSNTIGETRTTQIIY